MTDQRKHREVKVKTKQKNSDDIQIKQKIVNMTLNKEKKEHL